MKYFLSSLTKNAFTWFATLQPNSIHSWDNLERCFHEQFFKGEMKVSLIDLFKVKRLPGELIDDYLARFQQMRNRCFTSMPECEMVKMATRGLNYYIRKKLVGDQFLDMSQLAEKV